MPVIQHYEALGKVGRAPRGGSSGTGGACWAAQAHWAIPCKLAAGSVEAGRLYSVPVQQHARTAAAAHSHCFCARPALPGGAHQRRPPRRGDLQGGAAPLPGVLRLPGVVRRSSWSSETAAWSPRRWRLRLCAAWRLLQRRPVWRLPLQPCGCVAERCTDGARHASPCCSHASVDTPTLDVACPAILYIYPLYCSPFRQHSSSSALLPRLIL